MASNDERRRVIIEGSFYEIYNEKVRDLLNENPGDLKVTISKTEGTIPIGLKKVSLSSLDELKTMIFAGSSRRVMASTSKNTYSSRSHAIV